MTAGGRVLVTGATGYVGGRLTAALEHAGVPVRCLARRPEALAGPASWDSYTGTRSIRSTR